MIHSKLTVDDLFAFWGAKGSNQDRQMEFLAAEGYTDGGLNERWEAFLTAQGYTTGSLQDRQAKWYEKTLLVLAARRAKGFAFVPSELELTVAEA